MDIITSTVVRLIVFLSRLSRPLSGPGAGSFDVWSPGKKIRILLAGYNGARNTGSDVRVAAIAGQVRELFGPENVKVTVMTLDRDNIADYFDSDVELFEFSTLYPIALTLFLCEAAGVMSAQRKSCIAYGSEVGEMEPFLEKTASRLCRDTYFITRTADSQAALEKLGLKGHTGTDAAWLYDGAVSEDEADRLLKQQGWDGIKPLIGIAVIDPFCWPVRASLLKWVRTLMTGDDSGQYDKWYYFSDSFERRENFRKYIDGVAEAVNSFTEEYDYFPVLIGMERLDEQACRLLKDKLGCPPAMFLSGNTPADIMTGILRRLSMLVTSRYHAAVLSMEHGCPIIAISMDERLDGIMKELSLDKKFLLHVQDEELGRHLKSAMSEALKDRLREMGTFLKKYIEDKL